MPSTTLFLIGALLLSLVTPAHSQAPSPAVNLKPKLPAYELAAIKPSKPGVGSRIWFTADGLSVTRLTLKLLIKIAYGVNDDQIFGGPKWIDSNNYDVEAKVDSSDVAELSKLDDLQRSLMLQNLLAERFRLGIHRETRDLPAYVLIIAKNGSKIREAKPGDTYPDGFKGPDGKPVAHAGPMSWGNGRLIGQGIPLAQMASALSQQLGRTVQDRTELKGIYDIKLEWTPDEPQHGQPGPDNSVATDSPTTSLFTAIQEQLGLKIESRKVPLEVLVIDHADPPTEN
jgi:uncharacterized protein (TIGR03435 family)